MQAKLSHEWQTTMHEAMGNHQIKPINFISQYSNAITWMVLELTSRNIPFKVLNLGGSVKQVTTDTHVCPKCHGSGKI